MAELEKENYCTIHCEERYMPRSSAIKAIWALAVMAVALIGSSVTYAISTTAAVSRVTVIAEQSVKDIQELKKSQDAWGEKLDNILTAVTENGKAIRKAK